ncbi:MAG: hypothetical protein ACWA5R_08380 [bacterium]
MTSYSLSDEVSIEINDGHGNFQAQSVDNNIVAMYALATDIDGDGDLDLFTSSYDGHRIDWWQNKYPLRKLLIADGFDCKQ